jgi:hypothetical protein
MKPDPVARLGAQDSDVLLCFQVEARARALATPISEAILSVIMKVGRAECLDVVMACSYFHSLMTAIYIGAAVV